MPELPASVRVALWTTHTWGHGGDVEASLRRALPDVDLVVGLPDQLALWHQLGESAVYAALPRPGALGLFPGGSAAATDAAMHVGEALFAPGLGAASVPTQIAFGAHSSGLAVRWEAYDVAAVPTHRLTGIDIAAADLALRTSVHATIDTLEDGGWVDAWQRQRPAAAEREWALPPELPPRVRGLIMRAGAILEIADSGLDHAEGSSSAPMAASRRAPLQRLRDVAIEALETAACSGVAYLAAQSRATRS